MKHHSICLSEDRNSILAVGVLLLSVLLLSSCGGGSSSVSSKTSSTPTLSSLSVSPASTTVVVSNNQQFVATGVFTDGSQREMTSSVVWSSTQPATATISASGLAVSKQQGTAIISAASGSLKGSATLAVMPAPLVSLSVSPSSSSLIKGSSQQLRAIGTFSDKSTQDLTSVVNWTSSATSIATVSSSGLATAETPGNATVTVVSGAIGGTATVTVMQPVLVSIAVNPPASSISLGDKEQLIALGSYDDGSTQDLTSAASWQTNQSFVLTMSQTGMAAGQNVGSATVSATVGSINGSGIVSVGPLMATDYFSNANTAGAPVGNITVINTGVTGGNLCAMVYVFDTSQEMSECCGCSISSDGERTLSLDADLTANPLTQVQLHTGVIKIIAADPTNNPTCNAGSVTPAGLLVSWATHIQTDPQSTFDVTEERSRLSPLGSAESAVLQNLCTYVQKLGSGHGLCTCGVGD